MAKKESIEPCEPGELVKTTRDPQVALATIREIYETNRRFLQDSFRSFTEGKNLNGRVSAHYPYIRIETDTRTHIDNRRAYGYIAKAGVYQTTVTQPDIFEDYLIRQMELLLENNDCEFEVGVSDEPIPIHFALGEETHLESLVTPQRLQSLPNYFDLPDLNSINDTIVNGTYEPVVGQPKPLALFGAPRIDLSLQRLRHYTATSPMHFQNYIIFTNYQFYIDQFIKIGHALMDSKSNEANEYGEYSHFVEPGNRITYNQKIKANKGKKPTGELKKQMPQMPAYHLCREDGSGITLINIGVGPSNAKTITDHVAVLRPHAWLMLGHCAGLRNNQNLGDYVLAHAYLREDQVLDKDLPISIPLPALSEIQVALAEAVAEVSGLTDYELKRIMRTGTVATIDDRNWELRERKDIVRRLSQSRAIALEMESATIAGNGFRFRVPYGTLLCVSDKPLHGQLKLPGMADTFYRKRVDQHLKIGIKTMELLRKVGLARLHSRKLRSFNEVAFQ